MRTPPQKSRDVLEQAEEADREADAVLLTVKQYANLFGLHVQTVYSAIRFSHRLHGRVIRSSPRSIRIAVSRGSIQGLTGS